MESVNKVDFIDIACEEYSQEILGFSEVLANGNSTPYFEPIVDTTSPTLTPFEGSDFILEEIEAELSDTSYKSGIDDAESKIDETSIDEPPEVELKDLPSHLEYAFLEGDNKLPVIIAKDLSVGEKAALIKVLQSHKRAIAWKLSDIKVGIESPIELRLTLSAKLPQRLNCKRIRKFSWACQDFPDCEELSCFNFYQEFHILSFILGIQKRIFKKKSKKKTKDKQIQARSGKGKVKSHQNEENTT
ncbi:hypothetical protein Tco_0819106 [Tanacetum coccineum]|uniref:Reverse transcriptase domain-containing protein n=1 Tax=Tanacetum coccineum TaxID=301880 RepID=A0ABQ5A8J2_9ASTR